MTADEFLKMRMSGEFSPDGIAVWIGDPSDDETSVSIRECDAKRVDVRAFAGLPVFIYAKSYTESLVALVERISKITGFVLVAVADFGGELGWKVIDGEVCEL